MSLPPPPPRWGSLHPQTWPQDENHVPGGGFGMPPISAANARRSRRESFTMSGTFPAITAATPTGTALQLYLPTDQDGDFWCDQIYMLAWASTIAQMIRTLPAVISIADARTGRALTYPSAVPTNFFTTTILFSDDTGFDPATSPFPDGFRSTTTLPQPFCFTRAGGISMVLTLLGSGLALGANTETIDIAFGGWKEYEAASA